MTTTHTLTLAVTHLSYNVNDACRLLGIGRSQLYIEIAAGKLRSFRCGKRRMLSHEALKEYISEREAETAAITASGVNQQPPQLRGRVTRSGHTRKAKGT